MKIKVLNDFRNFKAGDVFDFSIINKIRNICVVGDNGCGKSSLFHALRGTKNDLPTKSLYEDEFKKLALNVNIEHEYDNIFYFDNIKDNGSNLNVSYDAYEFMMSGGFATKDKSHGESSLTYLGIFLNKLSKQTINEKTLLVFDEVDNGFSLKNMSKFSNIINNLVHKYNCNIICISHNPFFIESSIIVYDMEKRELTAASNYLEEQTGYVLKKNNKKENE